MAQQPTQASRGETTQKKRGLKATLFRWFLYLTLVGFIISLCICGVIAYKVYFGDSSHLSETVIAETMNQGTQIRCLDGKTSLGSFISDKHQQYVTIDKIPAHMLNAMIAAEDKHFYRHPGVNPFAMGKGYQLGFSRKQASRCIYYHSTNRKKHHERLGELL